MKEIYLTEQQCHSISVLADFSLKGCTPDKVRQVATGLIQARLHDCRWYSIALYNLYSRERFDALCQVLDNIGLDVMSALLERSTAHIEETVDPGRLPVFLAPSWFSEQQVGLLERTRAAKLARRDALCYVASIKAKRDGCLPAVCREGTILVSELRSNPMLLTVKFPALPDSEAQEFAALAAMP